MQAVADTPELRGLTRREDERANLVAALEKLLVTSRMLHEATEDRHQH